MRPNMEVMCMVKSLKFQYICHFCMVITLSHDPFLAIVSLLFTDLIDL